MPPRWLTWAIIAFWVGMTGWLTFQQYSLRQRAGEPPPFTIDLTDEVGANQISWTVLIDSAKKGQAYSSVRFRRRDRTFAFQSMFRVNDVELAKLLAKVESLYRVNQDGELLEFELNIVKELDPSQQIYHGVVAKGKVENGSIQPKTWVIFWGIKKEIDLAFFGLPSEIKVSGNILNPMHMLNKVSGLHNGQEWVIQLMEIKSFNSMDLPILNAKVSAETLSWNGTNVPCYLIEYREPRKQTVHARTWARQRDGLVLQQQAEYMGFEVLFRRDIERKP